MSPGTGSPLKNLSIEDMLLEMSHYGLPRLSQGDDEGWSAAVTLYVTPQQRGPEIQSFNHPTPAEALTVCMRKMYKVLSELEKT